jgi:anti-sigma factor RsiW
MCPDSRVLSVYFDGELPDPWKKRLEDHLSSCSLCREKIALYGSVREQDDGRLREAEAEARERVWNRLSGRVSAEGPSLWRRSVSVPLPVAAALALAVLALVFVRGRGPAAPESALAAGISVDLPGIVPAAGINGALQYLGNEDSAGFVIIRLPENRNFTSSGEPAILKAAEYARRNIPHEGP